MEAILVPRVPLRIKSAHMGLRQTRKHRMDTVHAAV